MLNGQVVISGSNRLVISIAGESSHVRGDCNGTITDLMVTGYQSVYPLYSCSGTRLIEINDVVHRKRGRNMTLARALFVTQRSSWTW